ncbi:hypothetical protein PCIT_a1068 [Pseudoalteromonas citrea]|uniref:Uncharacterized protein n=1 Tax=Pseudoalteromonas citrea TaxID=43655 RepID=A0AAD4FTG6_9GAMM|nr:hypothetical protein PCIT_a1068 [Pseudoalteromonas citrea]
MLFGWVVNCGWALTFVRETVGGDGSGVTKVGVLGRIVRLLFGWLIVDGL